MILQRKIFDTIKESYSNCDEKDVKEVSYDEFLESYYDNIYQTDLLFNQLNEQLVLKEADELAVINTATAEKTKKTLIEKIKELFTKFVDFCKTQLKRFIDWLKEKYMNTNVSDSFMQKVGKGITFDDLKKARAKGWKGIPVSCALVDPAQMSDISILKSLKEEFDKNNYNDICEQIIRSEDLKSANEKYEDLKEKLRETRKNTLAKSADSENFKNSLENRFNFSGKDIKMFFFITNDKSSDGKYYYPNSDGFAKVKTVAEKGESFIKSYKSNLNSYLKSVEKELIDPEIAAIKSFKSSESNSSGNKDVDQINILYHKAKLSVAQASLKAYSNAIQTVISLLKMQHETAIKTYLALIVSTRKYITEAVEISTDDLLLELL